MSRTRTFECDNCKEPVPYEVVDEYRKFTIKVPDPEGGRGWYQHRLNNHTVCCPCGAEYKLIKLDWGGNVVRERIR